MSTSHVISKLNDAADAIADAMAETSFINSAEYLNLRDNVVPKLNAIRGRLVLAQQDEQRRR